jgi:hypothetical protein
VWLSNAQRNHPSLPLARTLQPPNRLSKQQGLWPFHSLLRPLALYYWIVNALLGPLQDPIHRRIVYLPRVPVPTPRTHLLVHGFDGSIQYHHAFHKRCLRYTISGDVYNASIQVSPTRCPKFRDAWREGKPLLCLGLLSPCKPACPMVPVVFSGPQARSTQDELLVTVQLYLCIYSALCWFCCAKRLITIGPLVSPISYTT